MPLMLSPQTVSNVTLNQGPEGGFSWCFNDWAQSNPNQNSCENKENDILNSQPVILGKLPPIKGDAHIKHDGIRIKYTNSLTVAIPKCLDFVSASAAFVTQDLIKLLGPEKFEKSTIGLVVQRNIIAPEKAGREQFSKWHDHVNDGSQISLTYQFSDALQTELKHPNGHVVAANNGELIRMGSAILHRSQTNKTDGSILRTWGAFLVYDGEPRIQRSTIIPNNKAFNSSEHCNVARFKKTRGFTPYSKPIPLFK